LVFAVQTTFIQADTPDLRRCQIFELLHRLMVVKNRRQRIASGTTG
jgi:hypothetical protein